jgi:hypothetical protein
MPAMASNVVVAPRKILERFIMIRYFYESKSIKNFGEK